MKGVKKFFIVWAVIIGLLCVIGAVLWLVFLIADLLLWISPTHGLHIFAVLLFTGLIALCATLTTDEKAGGAPY